MERNAQLDEVINSASFRFKLKFAAYSFLGLFFLGLAMSVVMISTTKGISLGWGMTIGVPLLLGAYAGLFAFAGGKKIRDKGLVKYTWWRILFIVAYCFLAVVVLLIGYFFLDALLKGSTIEEAMGVTYSGTFCMSTFILIFLIPIFIGVIFAASIGKFVRERIIKNEMYKKGYLSLLILLSLGFPPFLDLVESQVTDKANLPIEKVVTIGSIPARVNQVWNHLQFYEDTGSESPLLFAMGFPKPLRTEGELKGEGSITKCVYNKGHLTKRTTKLDYGEQRAYVEFDVVEQVNIEDRAVELSSGSFELLADGNEQVKIELTTNYKPKMTPRWVWRPLEEKISRALHHHVIDKISADVGAKIRLVNDENL